MQVPDLGLFDIMQVDPLDVDNDALVFERRLKHLALADDLGFQIAFSAERHFMGNYRCASATAWIAAASQRTIQMRLGVLAYTLPMHQPVQLAEDVAVLDNLCNGRLEIGVGLGHREEELIALGVDISRKIPMFQQRLAIMKALWTGARVTTETPFDTVNGITLNPLPIQQPYPPLWFAGTAPGAATWAGAQGMNLAVGFATEERLLPTIEAFQLGFRDRADSAGDDGLGRIALMRHVYVGETDTEAYAEMADDLTRIGHFQVSAGLRTHVGEPAEIAAEVRQLIAQEIFIAGGPETVAGAILSSQTKLGFGLFLANPWDLDKRRAGERTMRMLAGPVQALMQRLAT